MTPVKKLTLIGLAGILLLTAIALVLVNRLTSGGPSPAAEPLPTPTTETRPFRAGAEGSPEAGSAAGGAAAGASGTGSATGSGTGSPPAPDSPGAPGQAAAPPPPPTYTPPIKTGPQYAVPEDPDDTGESLSRARKRAIKEQMNSPGLRAPARAGLPPDPARPAPAPQGAP